MNIAKGLVATSLSLLLASACTGGDGEDVDAEPSEVAAAISQSVTKLAVVAPTQVALAKGLFSIPSAAPVGEVNVESCSELEGLLNQSCELIEGLSSNSYCYAESTFFMAHSQPRCAARLHISNETLEDTYAFDLTGSPEDGPADTCGDGTLDEGEMCDDGNLEDFDGCSSLCETEEFQGCEAVIEQYYEQAQLAFVDRNLWDGPRSHLMVNKTVQALNPVDQRTCNAALAVGVDVCNELTSQMPFVGGCELVGGLRLGDGQAACDLRFQVYFQSVSPSDGVFTTAMAGILAFTISE